MVTFIWSTNASLPKISYVKSIDVFLVCCFLMTFASVIEYAMVSYVHIKNERRKRKKKERVALEQQQQQQSQLYDRLAMLSRTNSQTNVFTSNMWEDYFYPTHPKLFAYKIYEKSSKSQTKSFLISSKIKDSYKNPVVYLISSQDLC